jgi:FKBP-type peptidyl-prolyl cis-trans isomerase
MPRGLRILEEQQGSGVGAEIWSGRPATKFNSVLGSRQLIAGLEKSLEGMHEGGYRKVKISPHLAYRAAGVPDKVPANAVLMCQIWLKRVAKKRKLQR